MVIDVSKNLYQLNGNVIMDVDEKGNATPATLKLALVNAILSSEPNEKPVDKLHKYELAKSIYKAEKEVELKVEDVALIKRRVEDVYAPLIVGQVVELLEGKS